MPLNVSEIARPTPIYVIGDTTALAFNNLLVVDDVDGEPYVGVTKYIAQLNAELIVEDSGHLHRGLMGSLGSESLVIPRDGNIVARHTLGEDQGFAERAEPILLFSVGYLDVRALASTFDPHANVLLPFQLPDAELFEPPSSVTHTVTYDVIRALVERKASRLLGAFSMLKDLGFRRIYIQSTPPESPPDAPLASQRRMEWKPSLIEYIFAHVFNAYMAENVKGGTYRFLNVWDAVTARNRLRSPFYGDGIDLNVFAAKETLRILLSDLKEHDAEISVMRHVRPIYLFGDENVENFALRTFKVEGYDDEVEMIRAHYLPGFGLENAITDEGKLHGGLWQALLADTLVFSEIRKGVILATHAGKDRGTEIISKAAGAPRRDPLIVLSCGVHDIERARHADAATLKGMIGRLLVAAFALQNLGFTKVALREIPASPEFGTPKALNDLLAAEVARLGLLWLPLAGEGEADVVPFARLMVGSRREAIDGIYFQLGERARVAAEVVPDAAVAQAFKTHGMVRVPVSRNLVSAAMKKIRFGGEINRLRSLDWCSDGMVGLGWDRVAPVDRSLLEALAAVMYSSVVHHAIASVLQSEYSVLSTRIMRRGQTTPNGVRAATAPPNVIKAFFHLNGPRPEVLTIAAPELVFAEARKLEPGAVFADFVIVPADVLAGPVVVHAGPYAWPIDPLNPALGGTVHVSPA